MKEDEIIFQAEVDVIDKDGCKGVWVIVPFCFETSVDACVEVASEQLRHSDYKEVLMETFRVVEAVVSATHYPSLL